MDEMAKSIARNFPDMKEGTVIVWGKDGHVNVVDIGPEKVPSGLTFKGVPIYWDGHEYEKSD